MSVIIRLQGLSWSASAMDIRNFFKGLGIPPGGVHIIGGENGDAFIAFSTDEDARQAMMMNNKQLNESIVQLFLSSKTEMQNTITKAKEKTVTPTVSNVSSQPPIVNQSSNEGYGMTGYGAPEPSSGYSSNAGTRSLSHQLQKQSEPALPGEYSVGGIEMFSQHHNYLPYGHQTALSEPSHNSHQHVQSMEPTYSQVAESAHFKTGSIQSNDLQKILSSLPSGDPASLQKILQSALQITQSSQVGSGDSISAQSIANVGMTNTVNQQSNIGDAPTLFNRIDHENLRNDQFGQNKLYGQDRFSGNNFQSDGIKQRLDPRDRHYAPPFNQNPNFDQQQMRPFNDRQEQSNFDKEPSHIHFKETTSGDVMDPDHRLADRDNHRHRMENKNETMPYTERRDLPHGDRRGQLSFGSRPDHPYFDDRNMQPPFGGKDGTPPYVEKVGLPVFDSNSMRSIENKNIPLASRNSAVPSPFATSQGPPERFNENMPFPPFGERVEYGRLQFDNREPQVQPDSKETQGFPIDRFPEHTIDRSQRDPFLDRDHLGNPSNREFRGGPILEKPKVPNHDRKPNISHVERGQHMPLLDRGLNIPSKDIDPQASNLEFGHQRRLMDGGSQAPLIDRDPRAPYVDSGQQRPLMDGDQHIEMGPRAFSLDRGQQEPIIDRNFQILPMDRDPGTQHLDRGHLEPLTDRGPLASPIALDHRDQHFDRFQPRPFTDRGPLCPTIDRSQEGQFMNRLLPLGNRWGPPGRLDRDSPPIGFGDGHRGSLRGRDRSHQPSPSNDRIMVNANTELKPKNEDTSRRPPYKNQDGNVDYSKQSFGKGTDNKPYPIINSQIPSSLASISSDATTSTKLSVVDSQQSLKTTDSHARPNVVPNKRDAFGRDLRENETGGNKNEMKSGCDSRERSRDRSNRRDSPRHDRDRRSRDKDRDRDRNRDRDRYRDEERGSRRDRDRDRRNRDRDDDRRDRRREAERRTSPITDRGSKKRSLSPSNKEKKESDKRLQKDIPKILADNPESQVKPTPSNKVTQGKSVSQTIKPLIEPLAVNERPPQQKRSKQLGQDTFLGDSMDLDEPDQASPSDLFEDIIEVQPSTGSKEKSVKDSPKLKKVILDTSTSDINLHPELRPGLLGECPKEATKSRNDSPLRQDAGQCLLPIPDVPPLLSIDIGDRLDEGFSTDFLDDFGPRGHPRFRGRGYNTEFRRPPFGPRGLPPSLCDPRFEMRGQVSNLRSQTPWTPYQSFENRNIDNNIEKYPGDSELSSYQDQVDKNNDDDEFKGPQKDFNEREPPYRGYHDEQHRSTPETGQRRDHRGKWPYDGGRNVKSHNDHNIHSERRGNIDTSKKGFFSVIITGLSTNSSYRDIRRFFGEGEIARDGIKLINDSKGKRTENAYVRFLSESSLKSGLRKNNCLLNRQAVSIKSVPRQEFETAIDLFTPGNDNDVPGDRKDFESCNTLTATLQTLREKVPSSPTQLKKDFILKMTQLPQNTTLVDVQKYFIGCTVTNKNDAIVLDTNAYGVCNGIAFVEFLDEKSYEKALKYKRSINGKLVELNPSSKKEMYGLIEKLGAHDTESDSKTSEDSDFQTCVQIKNIPQDFSPFDARALFSGLSIAPRGVQVCHDSIGKPVGEVYVEFTDKIEAAKALKKDGAFYKKCRVSVKSISKQNMISNLRTLRQSLQPAAPSKQEVFYFVKASNLPEKVTTGELMYFFSGYSPAPESMRLNIQDGSAKAGTSTALIGFRNKDHAETAVNEVNQRTLRGKIVTLTKVIL